LESDQLRWLSDPKTEAQVATRIRPLVVQETCAKSSIRMDFGQGRIANVSHVGWL